jgi:hypothetical protein
MILTEENRSTRRKTCPRVTLSTKNLIWSDLELQADLQRDRLVTYRLSHGTAYKDSRMS